MICIRIFNSKKEAQWAKNVLEKGQIPSIISEDKFIDTPIQEYGVPARIRLYVSEYNFNKAAKFLASELRKVKSL